MRHDRGGDRRRVGLRGGVRRLRGLARGVCEMTRLTGALRMRRRVHSHAHMTACARPCIALSAVRAVLSRTHCVDPVGLAGP